MVLLLLVEENSDCSAKIRPFLLAQWPHFIVEPLDLYPSVERPHTSKHYSESTEWIGSQPTMQARMQVALCLLKGRFLKGLFIGP
jgi:hypothetical protein